MTPEQKAKFVTGFKTYFDDNVPFPSDPFEQAGMDYACTRYRALIEEIENTDAFRLAAVGLPRRLFDQCADELNARLACNCCHGAECPTHD